MTSIDETYPKSLIDDAINPETAFVGSTGALAIPAGTTAQRPDPVLDGALRYNETLGQFEGYTNGAWAPLGSETRQGVTLANTTLSSDDNGKIYNNKTAVVETNINPPAAAPSNFKLTLENMAASGMRFTVPTGSVIYLGGAVSSDGGFIEFFDVGASITLSRSNSTDWIVQSSTSGGAILS